MILNNWSANIFSFLPSLCKTLVTDQQPTLTSILVAVILKSCFTPILIWFWSQLEQISISTFNCSFGIFIEWWRILEHQNGSYVGTGSVRHRLLDCALVVLCGSESFSLCPHALFVVHPVLTAEEWERDKINDVGLTSVESKQYNLILKGEVWCLFELYQYVVYASACAGSWMLGSLRSSWMPNKIYTATTT